MGMSKREAALFLKGVLGGYSRRELRDEEYDQIRLILALLEPYEFGHSLHFWSEKYHYNGKNYEISREIADSKSKPVIEELIEIEIPDK